MNRPHTHWLLPILAACSAGPSEPAASPPLGSAPSASTPSANTPSTGTAAASSAAVAVASALPQPAEPQPAEPQPAEPQPPAACPSDMVLVEGDYCESLRVTCLKKWHAPQNNLHVCERVKEPTVCEGATRPMRFCVDRYEFPNRKGVRPMVLQNFYQAQVHCQQRGKRVCTEREWTKACEGPNNDPFPYGYVRDPAKCHGNQPWDRPDGKRLLSRDPLELERLWQGVVSGSQPECVSGYGVHDMPGNADELAASETYGRGPRSDFDNVTTGGPWYLGVRNMCRPKIYSHDESFAYYYLSWRCCAEPDGAATDPRAPKQLKRKEPWERIVWRANNAWKMPFNPLVPGDEGYAPAGPDRKPPPGFDVTKPLPVPH